MNATLTTVTEALWRWGRGIARALWLMGARAGITLGTVAYTRIVFRNAATSAGYAECRITATLGNGKDSTTAAPRCACG